VIPPANSTSSKKSESVYTCPRAPFYRETKGLFISKTPSASENIPSVDAYKNVFFVQHIYKSATSSHSKPGLFGTTTLTLLLRLFVNVFTWNSRIESSTDSRTGLRFFTGSWMSSHETPELSPRQVPELSFLRSSRHRQLEVPGLRMSVTLLLHRIKIPELHTFMNLGLRRFRASENHEFPAPEKYVSRTLSNLTFRGWRVFLNSPTLHESEQPKYSWQINKNLSRRRWFMLYGCFRLVFYMCLLLTKSQKLNQRVSNQ
jgi:hypothetical protein